MRDLNFVAFLCKYARSKCAFALLRLAVPALLEISREMVARGDVNEDILRDNEDALIAEAMRVD